MQRTKGGRAGSRIARIDVHQFSYVVENLGVDSSGNRCGQKGAKATIPTFMVTIETADGAVGEYCSAHGGKSGAMMGQVLSLAPHLLGEDAEEREALYDRAKRLHRHFGAARLLVARHRALGPCRQDGEGTGLAHARRLPPAASDLCEHAYRRSRRLSQLQGAYAEFAQQCCELGYRGFKIHGWGDAEAEEEAAVITHCAERVGDRMSLMYDGSSELRTFADAIYVGRACDEGRFLWYEDPYRDAGWSPYAARQLKQHVKTPLMLTEHVRGLEPKASWIMERATDYLRVDPDYDMGITGAMKIAHLAEAFGMDCEVHAAGPAQRHCIAAMRNTNWYELSLVAPGIANPIPPVFGPDYSDALEDVGDDGCFGVPQGNGIGITYDWDFILANRTAHYEFR